MELQPIVKSVTAKRLWAIVKIAFLMITKGLMSKSKSIGDMVATMKETKPVKRSLSNLSFTILNLSFRKMPPAGSGLYEYEFSCTNTPCPVVLPWTKKTRRCFPCIGLPKVIEDFVEEECVYPEAFVFMAKTPEYAINIQHDCRSPQLSPFSVRISNFSSDEEGDEKYGPVDHKAEEFIEWFKDQLRMQLAH